MIALRLAAGIAALLTITLNAYHGYASAMEPLFALLYASLYATLDIAKAAILTAAHLAWTRNRIAIAILCTLLYPPLFMNSLWNAVSQTAIMTEGRIAEAQAQRLNHTHLLTETARLESSLAAMQTSPLYARSAACADATRTDSKAYCEKFSETRLALTRLSQRLAETQILEPEPILALVASQTGIDPEMIRLAALTIPVLLAELIGSLGFFIAAAIAHARPVKQDVPNETGLALADQDTKPSSLQTAPMIWRRNPADPLPHLAKPSLDTR